MRLSIVIPLIVLIISGCKSPDIIENVSDLNETVPINTLSNTYHRTWNTTNRPPENFESPYRKIEIPQSKKVDLITNDNEIVITIKLRVD